jgi:hypothetical protein
MKLFERLTHQLRKIPIARTDTAESQYVRQLLGSAWLGPDTL